MDKQFFTKNLLFTAEDAKQTAFAKLQKQNKGRPDFSSCEQNTHGLFKPTFICIRLLCTISKVD